MHNFWTTILIFITCLIFASSLQANDKNEPPENLDGAIHAAAKYLMNQVSANGRFIYRRNLDPQVSVKPKYNVLRHAGTLYALAQYADYSGDKPAISAIEAGATYLKQQFVSPVPGNPGLLAVWSIPELTGDDGVKEAKLGGAGLGLVALCRLENLKPGSTPLQTLQEIGSFILFMQKENGSFHSKYIPSRGGLYDAWESLYYPGEAALGLLELYELDPNAKWIRSACDTLLYLADKRKSDNDLPADHWALIATGKLLLMVSQSDATFLDTEQKTALINHARQIAASIYREQIYISPFPNWNGGYATDGRTTPAATRLEGLLATRMIWLAEDLSTESIDISIGRGMDFLLSAQVDRPESFNGAFTRVNLNTGHAEEEKDKPRKWSKRATEVRIDYVQHALSAMIGYSLQKKN